MAIYSSLAAISLLTGCVAGSTNMTSATPSGADDHRQGAALAVYRANAGRTGEYDVVPPSEQPTLQWKVALGERPTSPPLISDGTLYITLNDRFLHAYDASTGVALRQTPAFKAPPTAAQGVLYYGFQYLMATDAKTFADVRTLGTSDVGVESSPLVISGTVYYGDDEGYFSAVDLATGQVKWQLQRGVQNESAPAYQSGLVYFDSSELVSTGADTATYIGSIHAVDAQTGAEQWSFKTADGVYSPLVYGNFVYCVGQSALLEGAGTVYVLDAKTGENVWHYKLESAAVAPLAAGKGLLLIGQESGTMTAIDVSSRQVKWIQAVNDFISSGPSIVGDAAFFGAAGDALSKRGNYLYKIDLQSGRILWQYPTKGIVRMPPVVDDGRLYSVDDAWQFVALH